MAKRYGAMGRNATKRRSHPRKTAKRLAAKRATLASRSAKKKR